MDVVVKHAFVARGEGELTAKEGELLLLVEQTSSEWWEVQNREGDSGWIPSTYLHIVEASSDPVEDENLPHNTADIFIAVYSFTADQPNKLSFKVGAK